MKVRIEKREPDKKGRQALRLVYHFGSSIVDGKTKHNRKRETLDLFIYQTPKSHQQRQHNKEINQLAEAIKSKRIVEYQSGKWELSNKSNEKANFFQWFQKVIDDKARFGYDSNVRSMKVTLKHLRNYHCASELSFQQVTPSFLEGFRDYLLNEPITRLEKKISASTARSYFGKLKGVLYRAYKNDIIRDNPVKNVKGIRLQQSKRAYLTLDELKILTQTECRQEVLKRAFLFGCMTGLRWSDIYKLTWEQVQDFDYGARIIFNQQKTGCLQYLDLNERAVKLMGEKGSAPERIFNRLKLSSYNSKALSHWVIKAGINKHITFHSSRHTFAVLQLTMGTDIYTVSKLLGHANIKTTQIYADIIDEKRREAMQRLPDIFAD